MIPQFSTDDVLLGLAWRLSRPHNASDFCLRLRHTEDVLRRQCMRAFNALSAKKAAKMVIAYEPVWAIGTGKTATPQMASDAHVIIRAEASKAFGQEFADALRILYGGSVKPDNATALMSEEEIDGALVGGASLDPKSFSAIVRY